MEINWEELFIVSHRKDMIIIRLENLLSAKTKEIEELKKLKKEDK